MCEKAKLYYYDCLCEEKRGPIPLSTIKHIEQCSHCQNQINQLKDVISQKECINSEQGQDSSAVTTMLELHFAYIGKYVTCETVRPFLPGMLDPDIEIRIPTPITVHLDNCPKCAEDLKEIQKLNLNSTKLYQLSQFFVKGHSPDTSECSETAASVTAIAERPDSEVVTIYHVDESAQARQAGEADNLYAGFPIRVEVIKQKVDVEQPAPTFSFTAALKEKVAAMNLMPFLKIGIAAAVILIVFVLYPRTPSAKAVSLKQIYKAIGTVKNVYISRFEAGSNEPIQEEWISQTKNIYMTKTPSAKVSLLWDMKNNQRKILPFDTDVIETNQLLENDLLAIKKIMSGSLGLMPFNDIAEFPPGSQLNRVEDEIPGVAEGTEIYDLEWSATTSSSSILKKSRYFIDPKTNLPQRIEISRKSTNDDNDEYQMTSTIEIEYLRDSEILKAIKDAGFAEF
jgi:hypothetical protein